MWSSVSIARLQVREILILKDPGAEDASVSSYKQVTPRITDAQIMDREEWSVAIQAFPDVFLPNVAALADSRQIL